jgi:HTH-type transcriptional regulator / antitoxin MqsA
MDTKGLCPICGEGHVAAHVDQVESEYKGRRAMVPLHYKVCDTCKSDFAGALESRLNKRAVLAFRKSVDGLLTGAEIRALRDKYKLTQDQAARLFGGGPVAFSKYENDDVAHSESMDTLLRLVAGSAAVFWTLIEQKGMSAELPLKRVGKATRVFRIAETNVFYLVRSTDAAPAAHISQSHQYAAFSVETSPEDKAWK